MVETERNVVTEHGDSHLRNSPIQMSGKSQREVPIALCTRNGGQRATGQRQIKGGGRMVRDGNSRTLDSATQLRPKVVTARGRHNEISDPSS